MFYFAELPTGCTYGKYQSVIKTNSLLVARRVASRKQFFSGTTLVLAKSVDENGWIEELVARKIGNEWYCY